MDEPKINRGLRRSLLKKKDKKCDKDMKYFSSQLEKTLLNFFLQLARIKSLLPVIADIKKSFGKNKVTDTALMLLDELKDFHTDLFEEDPLLLQNKLSKIKLFKGKLDLKFLDNEKAIVKYIRNIYIYSKGCESPEEALKLITQQKSNEAEEAKESNLNLGGMLDNLPPNLGSLVKDLLPQLTSNTKDLNLNNIDLSNPMSLLNSGLDFSSIMTNLVPSIQNKIKEIDKDELGKELASLLKEM